MPQLAVPDGYFLGAGVYSTLQRCLAAYTWWGGKHPKALGSPGIEVWPEVWDILGVQLDGVLKGGEATWSEDLLLPLERYGYLEEAYFTYSYSPIKVADGRVGGAFTAVFETTERVLGERRMRILRAQAGEDLLTYRGVHLG